MRIAVVGSGVSGLVAADLLASDHEVVLFEASPVLGGHARTVDVPLDGQVYPVDTGFVVFNPATYTEFCALLDRLGVASRPASMSFSVRCDRGGLEYCGSSLVTLFAQPANLLRPGFHRMLVDILRFNRDAERALASGVGAITLGDYLARRDYSPRLVDHYLLPMTAAIWSSPAARMLDAPAEQLLRFLARHGLLRVRDQLAWRVVEGGSRTYVDAISRSFRAQARLGRHVRSVCRTATGVLVGVEGETPERFDEAVLAVHADHALRILDSPSDLEREILTAFPYQENDAVLHTDASLLPTRPRARASWNYLVPADPGAPPAVTYDMSRLQSLGSPVPICVTLNPPRGIDPARVLQRMRFAHPLYTTRGIAAQARHAEVSGVDRVHFCGAYWGSGFHEDGVRSALAVHATVKAASGAPRRLVGTAP